MMMIIPVVVGYLSGEKERGSSALLVKMKRVSRETDGVHRCVPLAS